jgi:preprotein translocase subunit SecA
MINFIGRKLFWKSAQDFISRLKPAVNIQLPLDAPLPSIGLIKRMAQTASVINSLEEKVSRLSQEEFCQKTGEFKAQIQKEIASELEAARKTEELYRAAASPEEKEQLNEELKKAKAELNRAIENSLDKILPEAFAMVREAGKRTVNMRHFDVQLVGGMVLHKGKIAEMATGEGKTLVATLAAYLNALSGKGVHIVTVNDYLAKRDSEWMGPIYKYLGLSVGVIQHDMNPQERQYNYNCDITYGTNNEFGFDYLRDNMVIYREEMVQREMNFAVVDEVDSILIDEARTPLIISGPAEESTEKYYIAKNIARQLRGRRITDREEMEAKAKGEDLSAGFDYVADEKAQTVSISEEGEKKAASMFKVENLHEIDTMEYRHHVIAALRAKEFFQLDVDYVVKEGQVIIVDEFTGRLMPGRRWSDGLHQAVEAKEGMKIERENQTLATITFQNYFRMYNKLSGMTGTAFTEEGEFKEIYKLDVVVIPTNRTLVRTNYSDAIYKTEKEKFNAVVEDIAALYEKGRPVLVGTVSIEKSERLSSLLKKKGVPHQVLNAKYHEMEAQIVAQAGRFKGITIATNMAGRGTDILLGGNADFLAKTLMAQKAKEDDAAVQDQYQQYLDRFKGEVTKEHAQVVELGGLHVLGTERHEARRIDNQLRGRSGRQGDPGSSRFYVSLEDELMRLFGSDRIMNIMSRLGMEEGQVIEHPLVSRAIEIAQKRVETHNFEIRKQLLEYDNVMNKQREIIYSLRRQTLEGHDTKEFILQGAEMLWDKILDRCLPSGAGAEWNFEELSLLLKSSFGLGWKPSPEDSGLRREEIREKILSEIIRIYEEKEKTLNGPEMRHLERLVMLQTIDAKWKDHLYAMDNLKEGIGLRAYAQRDPLIEYQREAFDMFEEMFNSISDEVVEIIYKIQHQKTERLRGVFAGLPKEFVHSEFSVTESVRQMAQPTEEPVAEEPPPAVAPIHRDLPKVGRNDPCPCGSGKKYKKCCGK